MSASATSDATITSARRRARRLVVAPRPASWSTSVRFGRIARHAGTSPTSTPDATAIAAVNASTGRSIPIWSARGTVAGIRRRSTRTPAHARPRPTTAPEAASSPLSTSDRRTSARRPAPRAARIEKSLDARAERASIRFETLAHAMSSTRPTAPRSTHNVRPMPPTTWSCAGTSRTPQPALVSGCCRARFCAIASISDCACASVEPGASRPMARYIRCGRDRSARASSVSGDHSSTSRSPGGNWNPFGMTPTISKVWPSS